MNLEERYEDGAGWTDTKGCEQCPECGRLYSANGGYIGPVYDPEGTRYEGGILATEPGEGPFPCEDCWQDIKREKDRAEHHTLDNFERGAI